MEEAQYLTTVQEILQVIILPRKSDQQADKTTPQSHFLTYQQKISAKLAFVRSLSSQNEQHSLKGGVNTAGTQKSH